MVLFGEMLRQSANSWLPQGGMGAVARGVGIGAQQLGRSMGQSLASWRPGVRQPVMMPDMMAGGKGQPGGQSGGMGQYLANSAPGVRQQAQGDTLSSLGAWRQKAHDANAAGRPLSYFDIQDGNAREAERFQRDLGWSNSDEIDYAKVLDGITRASARDYSEKERQNSNGANFNWRATAAGLQEQDGLGMTRATEAGGRTPFADGNQQRKWLQKARDLGQDVPETLWQKGEMLADAYDQRDAISGASARSQNWYNPMSTYNTGYKSMGMGAGAGATNNGAVYGGDFMDARTGANGSERDDALGAKDWNWNKFHNNNLSYGGGNYVGSSPQQDQNRLSWYKKATSWPGGGVMHPMGPDFNGPNGAGGRWQAEEDRQQNPEGIVPGATYPKGWQAPIYDYGGQVIRSGVMDAPNGGAVGAPGRLSLGNDVFDQGNYGSTSVQAPVMSSNERMLSQYRNMADGFDGGYFGAQNGAYSGLGNYRPRSFWMTK